MNLSEFLQTAPEFADLTPADIEILERAMTVRNYPDGHEFIKEDAVGDAVYLILDGEVCVRRRRGRERGFVDIKRMRPGELFGLISLIDQSKHHASCKAIGPVRAASLPRTAFELLYETNSPLPHHFQHIVARQLARDLRAVTRVLRQDIFGDDTSGGYTGPERRSGGDRRRGERRQS